MLDFKVDTKEFHRSIEKAKNELSDFSELWEGPATRVLKRSFKKVFDTEGGIVGPPWAPNVPWYHQWKVETYGSTQVGVRRGDMRDDLTKNPTVRTSRFSMEYGDDRPYSHLFDRGNPDDNVPSRPLYSKAAEVAEIPLSRAARKFIREKLND